MPAPWCISRLEFQRNSSPLIVCAYLYPTSSEMTAAPSGIESGCLRIMLELSLAVSLAAVALVSEVSLLSSVAASSVSAVVTGDAVMGSIVTAGSSSTLHA